MYVQISAHLADIQPFSISQRFLYPCVSALSVTGSVIQKKFLKTIQADNELIKSQQAEIVQASRLSAVGEMAGGVGHEINNPLGILVGLSNSLSRHASRDKLTNEVAVDISAKIKLTVERIHRVVNGLLNISRKDNKGELTDTKLADVVLTVLDLCGEKIKMAQMVAKIHFEPL